MADIEKVQKYQSNRQSVRGVRYEQSDTVTTRIAAALETRQSSGVTIQNVEGLQSNAQTVQIAQAQAGASQSQPQAKK